MKFCVNCKHYQEVQDVDICTRPREPLFCLVTGRQMHREQLTPGLERYRGECGEDAKFFETR